MSARCKSCGAAILWLIMTSGKRMPVDAKPEKRIVLDETPDEPPELRGSVVDTYVSHFQTCPNAAQHRRPRT